MTELPPPLRLAARPRMALADDAIHVWIAARPAGAPCSAATASPAPARTPTHETAWTRGILARYASADANALTFERGACGKPALARQRDEAALHFNLSHSGDFIALAVARHAVGIDIECIAPIPELQTLVLDCLDAEELRRYRDTPAHRQLEMFHRLWTRKEACLKAIGTGLQMPPGEIGTIGTRSLAKLPGVELLQDWRHDARHHVAVASARAASRISLVV